MNQSVNNEADNEYVAEGQLTKTYNQLRSQVTQIVQMRWIMQYTEGIMLLVWMEKK